MSLEKLRIQKYWWIGAAVAGALVAIVLPRFVPGTDTEQQQRQPYPRTAEHAEI